jgi:hypothetical protein
MKNFLDLRATDLNLQVTINGKLHEVGLYAQLTFDVNDLVFVDGIEVLPKYQNLTTDKVLQISEPFYQWYHKVSGQGWLLTPQISSKSVER